MKINAINSVNKSSHFKSQHNTSVISPTEKLSDGKKQLLGLAALSAAGIACICIAGNKNVLKNIKSFVEKKNRITTNSSLKAIGKKRGPEALRRYNYEEATRKMESLHRRLLNGEFNNKSPEALEKIRRNEIRFAKATGRLKPE